VAAGFIGRKKKTHMKKLSIAIAILAAAVLSAGTLTHHKGSPSASRHAAPATIQADYPVPTCPPDCYLPKPVQIPN
jgi:hypothetical protein